MFEKVLIAEDHESANISVQKTLTDLGAKHMDYVFYCDDAFTRLKKAAALSTPYDLLITDLSFEEDHREQELKTGFELINKAKQLLPNLKILVFSGEDRPNLIDDLYNNYKIDGYVRKARNDAKELKIALENIYNNKKHVSTQIKQAVKQKNTHEFTDFDITVISLLSQGMLQKDIPFYLQKHNIKPSGLSSIEKRINLMKEVLGFNKNEQLVVFCKDMGII